MATHTNYTPQLTRLLLRTGSTALPPSIWTPLIQFGDRVLVDLNHNNGLHSPYDCSVQPTASMRRDQTWEGVVVHTSENVLLVHGGVDTLPDHIVRPSDMWWNGLNVCTWCKCNVVKVLR